MNVNNSLIFKYIYKHNNEITSINTFKEHRSYLDINNYITIRFRDKVYYLFLNGLINKLNNGSFKIISIRLSVYNSKMVFKNILKS